jgi:hypothetical protein
MIDSGQCGSASPSESIVIESKFWSSGQANSTLDHEVGNARQRNNSEMSPMGAHTAAGLARVYRNRSG